MNNNDDFSTMNEAESEMIYEELIAAMRRKDPLIAEVFTRYHTYDCDAPEIAAELGIDKRKVYYLKQQKVTPYDQVYTDKVSFMLTIAQDRADQICEGLTSLSGGKAEILEVEEGFFPLSVGESD